MLRFVVLGGKCFVVSFIMVVNLTYVNQKIHFGKKEEEEKDEDEEKTYGLRT